MDIKPFPDKKYNIIYADPPWSYKDKSKSHGGGAESHYSCMNINDICNLPVNFIADEDCLLFCWVTYPMLQEGLRVIKAWGFEYKTCGFTWVKINKNNSIYMGMGRYTRANAEICLIGKKGKGCQRQSASIYNTQLHSRGKHSQKPDSFRNNIVTLCGDLPRIELFSRERFEGWDAWGNEI